MKTAPTSTKTRRLTKMAGLATAVSFSALAVLSTGALATEASAATSGAAVGHPAGYSNGYNDVLGTTGVFGHTMTIDGTTVVTYCLNQAKAYDGSSSSTYTSTAYANANLLNVAEAADIAVNHASLGTPLSDANLEAVAVQLAIWKTTSNFNYSSVNNAQAVARANQLAAKATPLAEPLSSANLAATIATGTTDTVTATLTTDAGTPLSGQNLTFSGPSGVKTLTTDSQGKATVSFAPAGGTEAVQWSGSFGAGMAMTPPSPTNQTLVTTSPVPTTRTATVQVPDPTTPTTPTTAPPGSPATTTPPTVPAASVPTTAPSQLPFTGSSIKPWYLIVVLAAAALAFALRRFLKN